MQRIGAMIGSPSDASEERQAITDAILRWNAVHRDMGVIVEPVRWETHATPGLKGRPQEMINNELIPISDILVAVFRSRAGSPTGKDISGTIEEIRRFVRLGKHVVLYFYKGDVAIDKVDPDQLKTIIDFRKEIQNNGLTADYSTIDALREHIICHLDGIVKQVTKSRFALDPVNERFCESPWHLYAVRPSQGKRIVWGHATCKFSYDCASKTLFGKVTAKDTQGRTRKYDVLAERRSACLLLYGKSVGTEESVATNVFPTVGVNLVGKHSGVAFCQPWEQVQFGPKMIMTPVLLLDRCVGGFKGLGEVTDEAVCTALTDLWEEGMRHALGIVPPLSTLHRDEKE